MTVTNNCSHRQGEYFPMQRQFGFITSSQHHNSSPWWKPAGGPQRPTFPVGEVAYAEDVVGVGVVVLLGVGGLLWGVLQLHGHLLQLLVQLEGESGGVEHRVTGGDAGGTETPRCEQLLSVTSGCFHLRKRVRRRAERSNECSARLNAFPKRSRISLCTCPSKISSKTELAVIKRQRDAGTMPALGLWKRSE